MKKKSADFYATKTRLAIELYRILMPANRLILIASIFAIGSYFLCALSGTIGWFNRYLSFILVISAVCFFALVLYSFIAKFLHQPNKQVHRAERHFLKVKRPVVFSVVILIAAHAFILTQNVSPSENLLGNHDQGMYLAAASHLCSQGNHAMETDWISQAPAEYRRFLTKKISPSLKTESPGDVTNTGTQPGFYLMDAIGSSQYIQFSPGYPTALAAFWSLGGYPLVLYSNVIICLLCGLMLATVCCNYMGGWGTLSTWLLFLFCPLTIWSANHLYAEPTLLLLWLITLWALEFSEDHPWLSATLASLSIGAAFLVKIDALPLFVVPLGLFISKGRCLRFRVVFFILSIVAYGVTTGFYLHYSKPYFEFTLSGLFSGRLLLTFGCILSIGMVFFVGRVAIRRRFEGVGSQNAGAMRGRICATPRKMRCEDASALPKKSLKLSTIIEANAQTLRYVLAISIGLILIYFYFVRPHMFEPHRVFAGESGTDIESLREQTFYRLGWYFTPVGLALASTGLIAAFIKRTHPAQLAFTGIALLFLLYYSYDIHCTPYQPYAMRRLFPFVAPALCFGIPFLIETILVKRCSPKIRGLIILLITAILVSQFQQITQKLIIRENYKGLYKYLSSVSTELPKNELILVNGKGQAYLYAAALRYIFERDCIWFYPDYRARDYHTMIDDLMANKDRFIYVLSTFPNDRINLRAEILSTQKLSDTLHTTYSGTETTGYPDNDVKPFKLSLYLTEIKMP